MEEYGELDAAVGRRLFNYWHATGWRTLIVFVGDRTPAGTRRWQGHLQAEAGKLAPPCTTETASHPPKVCKGHWSPSRPATSAVSFLDADGI